MLKYLTVAKSASAEQVIEKSRFIAHIAFADSKEMAMDFYNSIKTQYKDATHNVPVMVIGDKQEYQWASDDGEPGGTSGPPVLQMIVKENLCNIVVVITRYFGGIKLGPGGLVRAYTSSARMALEAAGIKEVRDYQSLKIEIPYSQLSLLQNRAKENCYEIKDIVYSENVILELEFESENAEKIHEMLSNIFSGNLKIVY